MVPHDRCSLTDSMGLSRDACSTSNWPSSNWSKWFPPWGEHRRDIVKRWWLQSDPSNFQGAAGEARRAAPLVKQTGSVSPPLTRVQHDTTAGWLRLYFRMLMEKFNRFNLCRIYIGQRLVPRHTDDELASRTCCYRVGEQVENFGKTWPKWHCVWDDIWALNISAKFSINMIQPYL